MDREIIDAFGCFPISLIRVCKHTFFSVYKHVFIAAEMTKCSYEGTDSHIGFCVMTCISSYSRNVDHASLTIFGNIAGLKQGSATDKVDTKEENLLEGNAT